MLQDNLNRLVLCGKTLKLKLNTAKCQVMSFTRSSSHLDFNYKTHGLFVPHAGSSVRDLGFRFSSNLSPRLQIEEIFYKTLTLLDFFQRISHEFKLFGSLKTLYCTLIKSETCTWIWICYLGFSLFCWINDYRTCTEKILKVCFLNS